MGKEPLNTLLRKTDGQGRILIGPDVVGKLYRLIRETNGDIILRPVKVVDEVKLK